MHFFLFRKAIRKLPGDVIREVALPEPELTEGFGSREQTGRICSGIPFSVFCDIDLEPTVDIIRAGRKAALECGADCIVALGGGSVMDSSKVIAASARNPGRFIPWHSQRKNLCLKKAAYIPGNGSAK